MTHAKQPTDKQPPGKGQQSQQPPHPRPEEGILTTRAPGTGTEPPGQKQMGEGDRHRDVKQQQQQQQQQPGANAQGQYGEGNYAATRDYNARTKAFVESGRVEEAALEAHPRDEVEAEEMAEAERQGKQRAKEEDPALTRKPREADPSVNQPPKPGRGPDE